MGQHISAIITNRQLEIPREIVHFQEEACTIIPIDLSGYAAEAFVAQALQFDRLDELIAHLRQSENKMNDEDHEHSLETLEKWIRLLKLDHFIFEHYSDFNSMETDCCFIAILNGQVIKESAMISSDGLDEELYDRFRKTVDLHHRWYGDEERYYFYHRAEEAYARLLAEGPSAEKKYVRFPDEAKPSENTLPPQATPRKTWK